MTFEEARKRLAQLSKGEYRAISYELTEYASGTEDAECTLYIDGYKHHSGPTWAAAFLSLEKAMDITHPVDTTEQPGEELSGAE